MTGNTTLQAALAGLEGRLHTAAGDKRCGCGPCAHQVAMAARRTGVPRDVLEAALPAPARPEPRERRRRRQSLVRISDSCTIRVRGDKGVTQEGLALLLGRFHNLG